MYGTQSSERISSSKSGKTPLPDLLRSGNFFPASSLATFPAVRCYNPQLIGPQSFHSPTLLGQSPWEANNIVKNFLKLIWAKSTKPFVTRSYQDPNDAKMFSAPKGLCVVTLEFSDRSSCKTIVNTGLTIARGAVLGPFQGRRLKPERIPCEVVFERQHSIWEVIVNGKVDHYIDGASSEGNWTRFIQNAKGPVGSFHTFGYNLEVFQCNQDIYFEAKADIQSGQQLVAWYSPDYVMAMGVVTGVRNPDKFAQSSVSASKSKTLSPGSSPLSGGLKITTSFSPVKNQISPTQDVKITKASDSHTSEAYPCSRCGKIFAYQYYRDKHLKYTRCIDRGDRKFPCNLCTRSFEKRDRLRIHVLHVHEKHRPHKCAVCGKTFSQSSSLNKHFRVHSGERPYKCSFCCKCFTASSILRTHLRQHSGEKPFKCRFCPKAFASHAAHDSHVRRSHPQESLLECLKCGIKLETRRSLNIHLTLSHK